MNFLLGSWNDFRFDPTPHNFSRNLTPNIVTRK